MWCIEGSKLKGIDAAKYLNVKPSYVSMVLHPEQWHACPAIAWKRFYEWFISDCVLEDFKLDKDEKILSEHLKKAGPHDVPKGSKKVNGRWIRPEDLYKDAAPLFKEGREEEIKKETEELKKGGIISSEGISYASANDIISEHVIPHTGMKEVESEFDPASIFGAGEKSIVKIPKGSYKHSKDILEDLKKDPEFIHRHGPGSFLVFDDPIKPSFDFLMRYIKDLERQEQVHITVTITRDKDTEIRISGKDLDKV
jgi:hypothetical protein